MKQACLHPVACKPCAVCRREHLLQLADALVKAVEYACEETTAIEGRDQIDGALAAYKTARRRDDQAKARPGRESKP